MYKKSPVLPIHRFKLSAISVVLLGALSACDGASEALEFTDTLDDVVDAFGDLDNDQIPNGADNCPIIVNGNQLDTDGDGLGDSCDSDSGVVIDEVVDDDVEVAADADFDGIADDVDNCPTTSNPGQSDMDANNIGDACDVVEVVVIVPPITDTDGDEIEDGMDNCPLQANTDQLDADANGVGDVCEAVDDEVEGEGEGEGAGQNDDDIQLPVDTDNDGLSDDIELELGLDPSNSDTDADGVLDGIDQFPNDPNASLDSDGDGVSDDRDQFPNDATETSDLNGDGLGDNANPFEGTVISGSVIDAATDTGIVDAQISLDLINATNETNPVVLTTTDALGFFSLVAEDSLIPDNFVVVVTADGFQPFAVPLSNTGDDIDTAGITLISRTSDFVVIEPTPSVHHLGDNSFSGSQNSQFQRSSEGASLSRSFNISSSQLEQDDIVLNWVAKGIQEENRIIINGGEVAVTAETNTDGSFTEQSMVLDVTGVLLEGANTLTVESVPSNFINDIDDFEFVFIGFSELD